MIHALSPRGTFLAFFTDDLLSVVSALFRFAVGGAFGAGFALLNFCFAMMMRRVLVRGAEDFEVDKQRKGLVATKTVSSGVSRGKYGPVQELAQTRTEYVRRQFQVTLFHEVALARSLQ